MSLQNKIAVVFAASGAIAGQVAKSLAEQGAIVHLSGRNRAAIDALADEIRVSGGQAEATQLDALDEAAIDQYMGQLVAQYGRAGSTLSLMALA